MKASAKVLLLGIAGSLVAVAVMAQHASRKLSHHGSPRSDGTRVELRQTLSGFDRLSFEDSWRVHVTHGAEDQVTLSVPQGAQQFAHVVQEGTTLRFWVDDAWTQGGARAEISMRDLTSVTSAGAVEIELHAFSLDDLEIDLAGAASVTAAQTRIQSLTLKGSGVVKVDLSAGSVGSAKLDLSGAADVRLTMAGGEITGSLSGAAQVRYKGLVSREALETSGMSRVTRD